MKVRQLNITIDVSFNAPVVAGIDVLRITQEAEQAARERVKEVLRQQLLRLTAESKALAMWTMDVHSQGLITTDDTVEA